MDPRRYQISALGGLLAYGVFGLAFDLRLDIVSILAATALAAQWLCWRAVLPPPVDVKSALVSALSLCLLLRTDSPAIAGLAASVTIASKFCIRVRGKHVFNPTNAGIAAALLLTNGAWVSPGQWGDAAFFALLVACLGLLVVMRAARSDVTLALITAWAAMLAGRSFWLGEPMAIPLHRLESGAFLIFAFFMISDPKTTPDRRLGRIAFAVIVAAGAYYVQFRLFRPNGLIWSLVVCSPLVPIIDWGGRYVEQLGRSEGLRFDPRDPVRGRGPGAAVAGVPGGILRLLRGARRHEALQPRVAGGPRS
jgi:Na+-transporting NADH:ubiquinone oxidoreductase subunit NqrB